MSRFGTIFAQKHAARGKQNKISAGMSHWVQSMILELSKPSRNIDREFLLVVALDDLHAMAGPTDSVRLAGCLLRLLEAIDHHGQPRAASKSH